jgi:hypothetical protein
MDNWRNFYFSNSSHLEWRAGLSDTILKGTIPARFGLIWFSSFRGDDLNVIFYQNMPNLLPSLFVRRPSVNISHCNLLLRNHWANGNQILVEWSLGGFGCGGHLGRRSEMPDTVLEGDHPRITSAKFGWDWLSSFRGEDFFLISSPLFSNLHNRYISAERKISQKNLEYMLNYSLPCSCS